LLSGYPFFTTAGNQLINVHRESTKPKYAQKEAFKAIKFSKMCMNALEDWLEKELPKSE